VRQQILGNIPHVLIQKHGENLADYQAITTAAGESSPHVVTAAPFINKEVMLLSKHNVAAVSARGITRVNKILRQSLLTIDGLSGEELLFTEGASPPGIVIALDTAAALGVTVGDTVNVIPPMFNITPFGMIPKMKAFRVVGIIQQRGGFIDTYFAYLALEEAQHFFGLAGVVSGIEIEVDSFDQARPVAQLLSSQYRFPHVVRSWEDLFGSFLAALNLEKLGLFIVLAIIVLVAAFNIATTLIMVVMEKHRDIAILRSMGATSRSIMRIFIL